MAESVVEIRLCHLNLNLFMLFCLGNHNIGIVVGMLVNYKMGEVVVAVPVIKVPIARIFYLLYPWPFSFFCLYKL